MREDQLEDLAKGRKSRKSLRTSLTEDYAKQHFGEDAQVDKSTGSYMIKDTKGNKAVASNVLEPLSPTKCIIADLAASGMNAVEIANAMHKQGSRGQGKGKTTSASYYRKVLKDPRVRERIENSISSHTEEARAIINSTVRDAAHNIADAVREGDLKESRFVLGTVGINEKKESTSNINLDFGSWLSSTENTKQIHNIEHREITTDAQYDESKDDSGRL